MKIVGIFMMMKKKYVKINFVKVKDKKIAIICDWIKDWWWAELVLEQLLEIFPQADIFTSVYFPKKEEIFKTRKITTSFIQYIPFLNKSHK
jgi:hypothetical protein